MPKMIVRIRLTIWPLREPTCAARTASAIVSELQISTAVLSAPSGDVQVVAAGDPRLRVQRSGRGCRP